MTRLHYTAAAVVDGGIANHLAAVPEWIEHFAAASPLKQLDVGILQYVLDHVSMTNDFVGDGPEITAAGAEHRPNPMHWRLRRQHVYLRQHDYRSQAGNF